LGEKQKRNEKKKKKKKKTGMGLEGGKGEGLSRDVKTSLHRTCHQRK
jgi:hypothetical protein